DDFTAVGFEICYHVRRKSGGYEFEGKEMLVIVMDKNDALNFVGWNNEADQQEALNRSEIYLNGKDFPLALNHKEPFNREEFARVQDGRQAKPSNVAAN